MDPIELLQVIGLSMLFGYMMAGPPAISGGDFKRLFHKRGDRSNLGKPLGPVVLVTFLLAIGLLSFGRDLLIGITPLGTETMGGAFEKRDYTAAYYILLFPEGSKDQNYRVPAAIRSQLSREAMMLVRQYKVLSARLPGGGVLHFEVPEGGAGSLRTDRTVTVRDREGRPWGVMLTKQKAPDEGLFED